jgi:glycerophosphoryl diester phosphodiesterase
VIRAAVAALAALGLVPGAAAAAPLVHAHRGGTFVDGEATYAENTLPAFQAAKARGFIVELDTRVTQDGGAIALHDDTLDRTTTCTGKAREMTLAQVAQCPSDTVGSEGGSLGSEPRPGGPPPPDLVDVLTWARDSGARLNLELNDHDADGAAARQVAGMIKASGYPLRRLIVQSFYAGDLKVAREILPGVELSALALEGFNVGALNAAKELKATWVSPQWPVPKAFVRGVHRAKRKIIPFTLNKAADVRRARKLKVDAVITDDPVMARKALRRR